MESTILSRLISAGGRLNGTRPSDPARNQETLARYDLEDFRQKWPGIPVCAATDFTHRVVVGIIQFSQLDESTNRVLGGPGKQHE